MDAGTTVQITMPEMGESVTEGTILEWLKAEGDPVEADEGIVEVSTDKVDTEIPAPASGILAKILVGPDETVPTGDRKSTRLNSSHGYISYAVFCLKKKQH